MGIKAVRSLGTSRKGALQHLLWLPFRLTLHTHYALHCRQPHYPTRDVVKPAACCPRRGDADVLDSQIGTLGVGTQSTKLSCSKEATDPHLPSHACVAQIWRLSQAAVDVGSQRMPPRSKKLLALCCWGTLLWRGVCDCWSCCGH
jgi:hypothetical protein